MSDSNNVTHDLAELLVRDGKRVPQASLTGAFLTTASLPVWAATVLPLSLAYQAGSAALRAVVPSNNKNKNHTAATAASANLDSGYVVDPSQMIERAKRKYDLVILGATGFTGISRRCTLPGRTVSALTTTMTTTITTSKKKQVQWAIAGRNPEKLNAVKQRLAQELGNDKLLSLDTILVDTSNPSSLPKLVANTRAVATTAGPFTLYGCSVVEFCAKFGTHYVDITGEVDWVKAMLCQWQETAQKTGAKIIPFCGVDSIPWDLSYLKLREAMQQECKDELKTVSFWVLIRASAPGGTFATVLNAVSGNSHKAPRLDFDPFLRLPDGSKSEYVCKPDLPTVPAKSKSGVKLPLSSSSSSSKENTTGGGCWEMPYIMSVVNAQVVRWSHALLQSQGGIISGSSKPITISYTEAQLQPDFKTAFVNYAGMLMAGSMLFNPVTLYLLKHFVIPKPGEGPSMSAMESKSMYCLDLMVLILNIAIRTHCDGVL